MPVSLTEDTIGRHWKHDVDAVREQQSSAWLLVADCRGLWFNWWLYQLSFQQQYKRCHFGDALTQSNHMMSAE